MSKNLILEIVLSVCSLTAFLISKFNPSKCLFWVAVALFIIATIGGILLKIAADKKKREICLQKQPEDWCVEATEYRDARLEIKAREHGKGSNINVRWEFVDYKHWDLEEKIENGNITIKYKRNNYPPEPRIPLHIYISGR